MPDPRATTKVLDELLWSLRREGFDISTAQAIDAARAVLAVGLENRVRVRDALAAIVLQRASERPRFEAVFAAFFDPSTGPRDLWERLAKSGVTLREVDELRTMLGQLAYVELDGRAPLGTLLEGGADLDRILSLAGLARSIDAHSGPQLGFQTHRLLGHMGLHGAQGKLGLLRAQLVETFGARGHQLADPLGRELERREDDVRLTSATPTRRASTSSNASAAGSAWTPSPSPRCRGPRSRRCAARFVRFAERLRGGARVRARMPGGAASTLTGRCGAP